LRLAANAGSAKPASETPGFPILDSSAAFDVYHNAAIAQFPTIRRLEGVLQVRRVLKLNECVSTRLASLFVLDQRDLLDGAIVFELLAQLGLGDIVGKAADEQCFHRIRSGAGIGFGVPCERQTIQSIKTKRTRMHQNRGRNSLIAIDTHTVTPGPTGQRTFFFLMLQIQLVRLGTSKLSLFATLSKRLKFGGRRDERRVRECRNVLAEKSNRTRMRQEVSLQSDSIGATNMNCVEFNLRDSLKRPIAALFQRLLERNRLARRKQRQQLRRHEVRHARAKKWGMTSTM
jgi:hypothetical protein